MSTRLVATDATLETSFKQLQTFSDVAGLLEVAPQVLGFYLHQKSNYKRFEISKRGGGKRVILAPVTPLRLIQSKLNQVLHAVFKGRSPAHGFVRGKSIVSNARMHVNRDFVLNFDLKEFFPTIHFGRVAGLFQGKPYMLPKEVALTLAQICCHDRTLPIGAPTSPIISNMICAQMDIQLKKLAIETGCLYTRYADDITFSRAKGRFPTTVAIRDLNVKKWRVGDDVEFVVQTNGFSINESKTRVLPRGYRQEVTGLVVNDRVNVKRKFVRQVRAMLNACEEYGVGAAQSEFRLKYDRKQRATKNVSFLRVLRGKIEFVGAVRGRDDFLYLRLLDRYLRIDNGARMRTVLIGPQASNEVISRAVWVLEDQSFQGTAFAVYDLDLLTAAHVLKPTSKGSCLPSGFSNIEVREKFRHDHIDVARCEPTVRMPIRFKLGSSANLTVGDTIRALGFPLHRIGAPMHVHHGRITALTTWHGVPHVTVDCPIVKGNSGGPILDSMNEVVGIAIKGQGTPKSFGDDDELSRFVPIDYVVNILS